MSKTQNIISKETNKQTTELEAKCKKLETYLDDGQTEAIGINYNHMLDYFHGRAKHPPRITIKGYQNGRICDIYRKNPEYNNEFRPESNTGFKHVRDTGQWYLCNDIPAASASGDYLNPRLVKERAQEYIAGIQNKGGHNHKKWIECWVANSGEFSPQPPSAESCYMSTLIIPMTLLNNQGLSHEFRNHFNIPRPNADKQDIQRAVYGCLCFDHREVGYFNDNTDMNLNKDICMGYVFADLLSLYIIANLNYLEYSKTYHLVKSSLTGY